MASQVSQKAPKTPGKERQESGPSSASKPDVGSVSKKATPSKLKPKDVEDDVDVPETPSPKSKKKKSGQQMDDVPDVGDAASQASEAGSKAAGQATDAAQSAAEDGQETVKDSAGQAEETAGQAAKTITGLADLEGLPVSEGGLIKDQAGHTVAKVVEGDPEELVDYKLNNEGEVIDEDEDPIGRVELLPDEEREDLQQNADATGGLTNGVDDAANDVKDNAEDAADDVQDEAGEAVADTQDTAGEAVDDAEETAGDATDQAKDTAEQLAPDFSILENKKINKKGAILDEEGETIGKVAEGSDLKKLVGKRPGSDGKVRDKQGEVLGEVEIVPGEAANEAMKSLHEDLDVDDAQENAEGATEGVKDTAEDAEGQAKEALPDTLEIKEVNENNEVIDASGQVIGKVDSGDTEEFAGKQVNARGLVTNDDGDIVGKIQLAEDVQMAGLQAEDTAQEAGDKADEAADDGQETAEDELPPLSNLEGLKCTKTGKILDSNGQVVGELVEGDPKKLSKLNAQLDDQGQFWDSKGHVIGKARTVRVEDEGEEAPFAGLDGLIVVKDGWVEDENGQRVGKLVEGDAKKLIGRAVDEDGDVLSKHGSVVGRAERYEEPEPEPEAEPEKIDLSSLKGLSPNKMGNVIGPQGVPVARLVDGNVKECAGKKLDGEGQVFGDSGQVLGHVELIPESERETKVEGPFAGLEGLVVNKDGFVEDEEGQLVGKLVEGDAKKLRGRMCDEDGDICDKYGNVLGRAEPYEAPEEEPEPEQDLSALEGKTINKAGNVVDSSGHVVGRITSGDPKKLAGRKVGGNGCIYGDKGEIIGKAELIPGGEEDREEGPFFGFDNAIVGKDGLVYDGEQIIGRVIEGDAKRLQGRHVDEDAEITDKRGNVIGRAERWEPEEKKRNVNPMAGCKVNRDGEVRNADGELIGKLTSGDLKTLVGKEVDDNGYVRDNDGQKVGECTLIENLPEPEPEQGLSEEELEQQKKEQQNREIAEKIGNVVGQTLDRIRPVCQQISDALEKADRTPKDELDEEKLVQQVKPLIEEGGRILQECNGSIRALDPDGSIAATAKARAASGNASPEEHRLANQLKELTETVVKTIDNGRKRIADMPHAKKKLNPLWTLLSEPLFQILAAVGLLLSGVLGLVTRLLDGLGLGGLVRGLLGGLGIDNLLEGLGLGSITKSLGLKK